MFERSAGIFWAFVLLIAALVVGGCGGGERGAGESETAAGEEGEAATSMAAIVDEATAATVKGRVVFEGTAPEPTVIDMSEEPTCAEKYDGPKYGEDVVVNENATLRNVFVYVKEGLGDREFPVPMEPVVLDQQGCWYTPRIFGVRVGQDLLIKNSDGVLHNINAKPKLNRGFNISQPVVMETKRKFRVPEVMVSLQCDVHGWMQAYAAVLDHPYFSVTGDDGAFNLAPLPPGTYVIEAWHEKYGTQTQEVTVGEGEEVEITFTFGGAAA
jgi:hypothetical protein